MKLTDVSPSTLHKDSTRYVARVAVVLTPAGILRIQKSVQAYTRDHSRVLVASTVCLGVLHRRGKEDSILSDVQPAQMVVATARQELKVSKIKVQPDDVIIFSLLPGGSPLVRSYYQGMVRDWADDLTAEEVSWNSWIALATNLSSAVDTGN